jgi:hypothetical protein
MSALFPHAFSLDAVRKTRCVFSYAYKLNFAQPLYSQAIAHSGGGEGGTPVVVRTGRIPDTLDREDS